MDFSQLNDQFAAFSQQLQTYFSQLNDEEKYGWIGEALGIVLVLTGIVLWIL